MIRSSEPTVPSPSTVRRRATTDDGAFVDGLLLADARAGLALVPEPLRSDLAAMQVRARRAGYATDWPAAVDWILEVDGRPVGRLLCADDGDSVHVVDVRVASAVRGRGVGGAALRSLLEDADASGRAVTLRVAPGNPAVALYRRLGFVDATDHDADEADLSLVRPPRER